MNPVLIAQIGSQTIQIGSVALPLVQAIVQIIHAQSGDQASVEAIMQRIREAQATADAIEQTAAAEITGAHV